MPVTTGSKYQIKGAGAAVTLNVTIRNAHRSVGAMLSGELVKRFGKDGLPDGTIRFNFTGSAGAAVILKDKAAIAQVLPVVRESGGHALLVTARMADRERPYVRAEFPLTPGAIVPADLTPYSGISFDQFIGQPTLGFQRVLQRAVYHVQSSGRKEVTGANVLVAIFGEKESHAVYFLNQRGVTRLDVVNYIAHGITKTPQQKQDKASDAKDDSEGGSESQGALDAYTVNLNGMARSGKIDPLIGRAHELAHPRSSSRKGFAARSARRWRVRTPSSCPATAR